MPLARALISFWELMEKRALVDHLKLCFLWYDETLIGTLGAEKGNDDRGFYDRLVGHETLSRKDLAVFTDVLFRFINEYPKTCSMIIEMPSLIPDYPMITTIDAIRIMRRFVIVSLETASNMLITLWCRLCSEKLVLKNL